MARTGKLWQVSTADGAVHVAENVVLAVGAWSNVSGLLPGGAQLDATLWGKSVYHARVSSADAIQLRDMPAVLVK